MSSTIPTVENFLFQSNFDTLAVVYYVHSLCTQFCHERHEESNVLVADWPDHDIFIPLTLKQTTLYPFVAVDTLFPCTESIKSMKKASKHFIWPVLPFES